MGEPQERKGRTMKMYPLINVTAGNKETGFSNRCFWQYEEKAAMRFINEQVELLGKDNVLVETISFYNKVKVIEI